MPHFTRAWLRVIEVAAVSPVARQHASTSRVGAVRPEEGARQVLHQGVEAHRLAGRERHPRRDGVVRRLGGRPPAAAQRVVGLEGGQHPRDRRPRRAVLRLSVRTGPVERRLAQPHRLPQHRVGSGAVAGGRRGLDVERPPGGHDVVGGVADLEPLGRDELRVGHEGPQHRDDGGVVGQVHLGQVVDERRRGGVGHVADRQLAGEAVGGGRVVREVGQVRRDDRAAVGVGVRVAEPHDLDRAGPVRRRVVRRRPRRPHGDLVAGQDPRGRLDVVLGVVAAADGVQLEQLAAEVLVGGVLRRVRVVEADAHGRVGDRGDQHLVEAAEGVGADGAAVVGAEPEDAVVVDRHVQVVLEELGHRLQQLPPRAHPAEQAPALVVGHRRPRLAGHRLLVRPHRRCVPGEPRPPALEGVAPGSLIVAGAQLGVEPRLDGRVPAHLLEQGRCHPVGEPAGQVQREQGRQPVGGGRLVVRTGWRRRARVGRRIGLRGRLVLAVPAGARVPAGVLGVDLAAVPLPLRLRLPLLRRRPRRLPVSAGATASAARPPTTARPTARRPCAGAGGSVEGRVMGLSLGRWWGCERRRQEGGGQPGRRGVRLGASTSGALRAQVGTRPRRPRGKRSRPLEPPVGGPYLPTAHHQGQRAGGAEEPQHGQAGGEVTVAVAGVVGGDLRRQHLGRATLSLVDDCGDVDGGVCDHGADRVSGQCRGDVRHDRADLR